MTFDELVSKVCASPPFLGEKDHAAVGGVVSRTLKILGIEVQESDGALIVYSATPPSEWKPPEQRHVRYRGQVPRRRGRR